MLEVIAAVLVSFLAATLAYKYYLRSSWVTFNEELDLKGKVVIITGANSGTSIVRQYRHHYFKIFLKAVQSFS